MKWKRGKLYVTNRDGVSTLEVGQNADQPGSNKVVRDNKVSEPDKRSKANGRGRKDKGVHVRSKDKVRKDAR